MSQNKQPMHLYVFQYSHTIESTL